MLSGRTPGAEALLRQIDAAPCRLKSGTCTVCVDYALNDRVQVSSIDAWRFVK